MSTEAMKLALEALEWMVANDDTNEGDEPLDRLGGQSWNEYNSYWIDGLNNARASITALREALAAQRKPLTDEQKLMCWARATYDADVEHKTEHQCLMDYATEIEEAHNIKENT